MKINYFYKGLRENVPDEYIFDAFEKILSTPAVKDRKINFNFDDDTELLMHKCLKFVAKREGLLKEQALTKIKEFFAKVGTHKHTILADVILYCYLIDRGELDDYYKRNNWK